MKKLITLFILATMLLSLAACGDSKDTSSVVSDQSTAPPVESSETVESSAPADESSEDEASSDTSESEVAVVDGKISFGGVTISVPDGFKVFDEMAQGDTIVLVPSDYPATTDNINIIVAEEDPIENYTDEAMELLGDEVTLEKITIDGKESVKITTESELLGVKMKMAVFVIFNDNGGSTTITFTSVSGTYDAEFAEIQNNIKVD